MTIEEYASKWAVVEHQALAKLGREPQHYSHPARDFYIREDRRKIFFEWAKDDPESPIADALRDGTDPSKVEKAFGEAYLAMLQILWKLDQ
jgi:hypothetical protein